MTNFTPGIFTVVLVPMGVILEGDERQPGRGETNSHEHEPREGRKGELCNMKLSEEASMDLRLTFWETRL